MVEVQKLRTFNDFCGPRASLCGDRARPSALAVAPCEFVLVSANPAEIVRVEALCNFLARETAFAIPRSRVRFPPGPRQLRLENRSF